MESGVGNKSENDCQESQVPKQREVIFPGYSDFSKKNSSNLQTCLLPAKQTNKQTDKNGINANIFNKYALRG